MHRLLSLLAIFLCSTAALAQTRFSGVVNDGDEPVVGATVVCLETQQGAATDEYGEFDFEASRALPLTIVVRSVGYSSDTLRVEKRFDARNLEIELKSTETKISDVEVKGKRKSANFQKIEASHANLSPNVSGGIEAVVKTQLGVSSNNELSSQYRVRGGNFDENMVYVNNIEIYRPFLIRAGEQEGLSFVNPDLVESLEFSSGGFDASYGDRMASVLDVKYKTPREFAGSARGGLLGASAHLEGNFGGRLSHITGFRYKTNRYVVGSLDTKGDYDPTFVDVQSFWSLKINDKLRCDLLGYYASNRYEFEPTDRETSFGTFTDAKTLTIYFEGNEDDRYQTGIAAASFAYEPNEANKFTLSASIYKSAEHENYDILGEYWLQQAGDDSDNIGVGGYMQHARNELYGQIVTPSLRGSHDVGKHTVSWEVQAGFRHFKDYVDEWEYRDSAGYVISPSTGMIDYTLSAKAHNKLNSTNLQAFVMDEFTTNVGSGRLTFTYGVRLSHLSSNDETLVSPRVQVRYAKDKHIWRMALGRYSQAPLYREMQRTDGTLNKDVEAQNSWQALVGYDFFFNVGSRPFKLTAEAYYKLLRDLNSYSIDNVRIRYSANNESHGYAVGADVKVNGELADGIESWASLSIMQTEENIDDDGAGYIPRPSDQRISFSMFFQDQMPNNKSIGVTLGIYAGSGLPFGPPNSERKMATNRMPGYKRIDLGLYKDFGLYSDGTKRFNHINSIRLGVDVFNLFDFSNTISYFWVDGVDGRQYAVPNYLTSRRINVKLSVEF